MKNVNRKLIGSKRSQTTSAMLHCILHGALTEKHRKASTIKGLRHAQNNAKLYFGIEKDLHYQKNYENRPKCFNPLAKIYQYSFKPISDLAIFLAISKQCRYNALKISELIKNLNRLSELNTYLKKDQYGLRMVISNRNSLTNKVNEIRDGGFLINTSTINTQSFKLIDMPLEGLSLSELTALSEAVAFFRNTLEMPSIGQMLFDTLKIHIGLTLNHYHKTKHSIHVYNKAKHHALNDDKVQSIQTAIELNHLLFITLKAEQLKTQDSKFYYQEILQRDVVEPSAIYDDTFNAKQYLIAKRHGNEQTVKLDIGKIYQLKKASQQDLLAISNNTALCEPLSTAEPKQYLEIAYPVELNPVIANYPCEMNTINESANTATAKIFSGDAEQLMPLFYRYVDKIKIIGGDKKTIATIKQHIEDWIKKYDD